MLRRSMSVLAMTTALAGLGTIEAGSVNPSLGPITNEYDPNAGAGVLDVGDLALQQAIAKEPSAIKKEVGAVVQTIGSTGTYNIFGSGFNITANGTDYIVTAGHVEKGNSITGQPTCKNQVVAGYEHLYSSAKVFGIDGRTGAFDGAGDDIYYTRPDLGMLRLQGNSVTNKLEAMPVQEEVAPLRVGQILYDTNYQPGKNGLRSPINAGGVSGVPDQFAGIVLGRLPTGPSEIAYAVLGLKAYNSDGQAYSIPGSSGSPWTTANGVVVGENSGGRTESPSEIAFDYGVTVVGEKSYSVTLSVVQVIGQNMLRPLEEKITKNDTCPNMSMFAKASQ